MISSQLFTLLPQQYEALFDNNRKRRKWHIVLPGVRRDVNSYLSYFKSDIGGAWEDSEIVDKNYNWSCLGLSAELLNRRMDRDGLDYALIVFAGHGYAERNGEIYFELSNEEILSLTTLKSFLTTQKVLLIADSCQCYIEDSECENRALS